MLFGVFGGEIRGCLGLMVKSNVLRGKWRRFNKYLGLRLIFGLVLKIIEESSKKYIALVQVGLRP